MARFAKVQPYNRDVVLLASFVGIAIVCILFTAEMIYRRSRLRTTAPLLFLSDGEVRTLIRYLRSGHNETAGQRLQ